MHQKKKKSALGEGLGASVGVLGSGMIYSDNAVFGAAQGHGFAAEQVNHLHDVASLRSAVHEGTNLKRYGADRIVDSVQIQTKYCADGKKSVAQCFNAQNQFVYWADDGRPMQIEVPADQWEDSVKAMRQRIVNGEVVRMQDGKISGAVIDPDEAVNIIRKGHYDYATARAIARSGTIEGVTFDAVKGIEVARDSAGISAAIAYAVALWRGDGHGPALKAACLTGLKVGGVAWLTSIATAQIGRTGLSQGLVPVSKVIVDRLGSNMARQITAIAGKDLSGAAAKSFAAKLYRGNVIAASVSTIVMSSADLFRMFEGRASFAQVFKTVAVKGASAAGGLTGAAAGAAQGAAWGSFIPGPGNLIGGVIGGLIGAFAGSSVAESATRFVMDGLIVDDAVEMLTVLQTVFAEQAQVYLLAQPEADDVLSKLEVGDLPSKLRDMYAATDRPEYARSILLPIMDAVAASRPRVALPPVEELAQAMESLLSMVDPADGAAQVTRMHNQTGSMSIDVPTEWQLQGPAGNPESFPAYLLPSKFAKVNISIFDAASTLCATSQAQSWLKSFLDEDAQRGHADVESTVMGGRAVSRFSVAETDKSRKTIWTTYYVARLARYFVYLQVMSRNEKINLDDHEAISEWYSGLQLHRVDATPQKGATTIVDGYSGIQMVVPPGWSGEAVASAKDSSQPFIFNLAAPFSETLVYAYDSGTEVLYRKFLDKMLENMKEKTPAARTSIRENVINGRPSAVAHFTATVDKLAIHLVITTLQFDGFVVLINSAVAGNDAPQYYEQCEALAWRVSAGVAACV